MDNGVKRFFPENPMKNDLPQPEPQWTDTHRRAALHELTERFQRHFTEQDVFHAAALFFGLLKEGVFIDKASVTQRMQRERAIAEAPDDESGRRDA